MEAWDVRGGRGDRIQGGLLWRGGPRQSKREEKDSEQAYFLRTYL